MREYASLWLELVVLSLFIGTMLYGCVAIRSVM
jgi:hypothetical protein